MVSENSMRKFIHLPDVISLGNGVMGLMSILCSIENQREVAALFILIAGVLDFLDGRIARKLGITSHFGIQLDSLCDVCSFIIAPVIFLYTLDNIDVNLRIFASVCYVLAGVLRLARFNITGTVGDGKYFEGMPVPFSMVIVALYFLFAFLDLSLVVWVILFLVHAFLMVSTIKIRKL